jgi:hypothetical protein
MQRNRLEQEQEQEQEQEEVAPENRGSPEKHRVLQLRSREVIAKVSVITPDGDGL